MSDFLEILRHDIGRGNFESLQQLASLLVEKESSIFAAFVELRLNDLILYHTQSSCARLCLHFYSALYEGLKLPQNLFFMLKSWNKVLRAFIDTNDLADEELLHTLLALTKTVIGRVTGESSVLLVENSTIPSLDFAMNHLTNDDAMAANTAHAICLGIANRVYAQCTNYAVNQHQILTILAPMYFPKLLQISVDRLSDSETGASEELVDSLFSMTDFLSCLSTNWQRKLSEYLLDNFVSPLLRGFGESLSLFVALHLFVNTDATVILHRIIIRLFEVDETLPGNAIQRISISPMLQSLHQPGKTRLVTISLLYSILKSSISENALIQLDLYPRKMSKTKHLMSVLTSSDADQELEIIPYNNALVSTLISMLSQDETSSTFLEFQLAYQFLIELLATGENRAPLEQEHVWQLQVSRNMHPTPNLL